VCGRRWALTGGQRPPLHFTSPRASLLSFPSLSETGPADRTTGNNVGSPCILIPQVAQRRVSALTWRRNIRVFQGTPGIRF
jgi:hypothetical protein